jgi:glycosyltransferase involved in cell wall biosynthesis
VRVLLVAHNFLPAHAAGTEVYTGTLARELSRRGHPVRVVATEKDVSLRDLSLRERTWEGIAVTEIVNNLFHATFRETWDRPAIDRRFGELLDRERPELVHFQHLMYLSIGCVEEAARRGLPIVFTLHDFWLQCPRFGQRIHADGTRCERIEFERCGGCLTSFRHRQSDLARLGGRWLAGVRATTGLDLSGAAKGAARALGRRAGAAGEPYDAAAAAELAREAAERDREIRERVVPKVARFLSPSRFLREQMIAWGIEPERIAHVATGIDLERFAGVERAARAGEGRGPLRVAFVGTLAPHKGPQVLLEAWSKLPRALRERGRLELFGPAHDPAFVATLAAIAARCGAQLHGPLPREDVARELAGLDLLVVPSVWHENAPLTVLEALALRTPVAISAIGGGPELVEPGRQGAHFAAGDPDDLARVLAGFLERPERLAAMFEGGAPPRGSAQMTAEIERTYVEASAAPRGGEG